MDIQSLRWTELLRKSTELTKQFNNDESICDGFAGRYLLSNLLILGIPLAIVLITYIAKTILRLITSFEKA